MKKFTTAAEMIEAYTADHNSRCGHSDEYFTADEVATYRLGTMMRHALQIKHGISITAKMAIVISGFGYVEA